MLEFRCLECEHGDFRNIVVTGIRPRLTEDHANLTRVSHTQGVAVYDASLEVYLECGYSTSQYAARHECSKPHVGCDTL